MPIETIDIIANSKVLKSCGPLVKGAVLNIILSLAEDEKKTLSTTPT